MIRSPPPDLHQILRNLLCSSTFCKHTPSTEQLRRYRQHFFWNSLPQR